MLYYKYDEHTGEYLFTSRASVDPLETRLSGSVVYARPGLFETTVAPPTTSADKVAVWNGVSWDQRVIVSAVTTANDVRAEASRRMQLLVAARDAHHLDIIIANASREAIRLIRKGSQNWTREEAQRAAELEVADLMFEAIRIASNALETDPPLNYKDDSLWP